MRAVELTGAGPTDSDLAAPIVLDGMAVGVLVVRGVSRMGAAALRDLAVIAEWLAPAFEKEGSAAAGGAVSGGRLGEIPSASGPEPGALSPAAGGDSAEARGLSLITF